MTENTKRELPDDVLEAEAVARADESRVAILRSRAQEDSAYRGELDKAIAAAKESTDHIDVLNGKPGEPEDLSGVSRGLSDSAGNFAPNLDVLTSGGIGVEASNSVAATEQQATSSDQVETEAEVAQRLGGESASQGSSDPSGVEIPADYENAHWRTRVALAERISGRDDVKSEDANGIIAAELARRG